MKNFIFHIFLIFIFTSAHHVVVNAIIAKSQSKILNTVVSYKNNNNNEEESYEKLIDLTHNLYSSQIIVKAKPLNKILTSSSLSFSVLLQIDAIYKNNENKNLNLASVGSTTAASSATVFTKIFLQNLTLPIIKASHFFTLNSAQLHSSKIISSGDILLNKSYILFLNKNIISHHHQQQHQQQHDFYTLVNLKSNRYIRERVPKLTLYSNPIEWNEFTENYIVNSLCKTCGKLFVKL